MEVGGEEGTSYQVSEVGEGRTSSQVSGESSEIRVGRVRSRTLLGRCSSPFLVLESFQMTKMANWERIQRLRRERKTSRE